MQEWKKKLNTDDLNSQIKYKKSQGTINTKNISDGYHTFGQLYHDRAVLFAIICNAHKDKAWKSKQHHDGTMFGADDEMFIVGVETPQGQYTYHYHVEPYWDMYDVKEVEFALEYDGHTFEDIDRLFGLIERDRVVTDREKLNAIVDYLKRAQDGIFESIFELSDEQLDSDYSIDLSAKYNVLSSVIVEVKRIIEKENDG